MPSPYIPLPPCVLSQSSSGSHIPPRNNYSILLGLYPPPPPFSINCQNGDLWRAALNTSLACLKPFDGALFPVVKVAHILWPTFDLLLLYIPQWLQTQCGVPHYTSLPNMSVSTPKLLLILCLPSILGWWNPANSTPNSFCLWTLWLDTLFPFSLAQPSDEAISWDIQRDWHYSSLSSFPCLTQDHEFFEDRDWSLSQLCPWVLCLGIRLLGWWSKQSTVI